ncbi:hypothetical protein GCM10007920_14120 [Ciceribacter naphthalenivorans]|uniref:DUF1028 domain-containing protein n=3 Tax=Pseudomonadota TaxID=1224 RepID=A0A512HNG2_9HYPH|nr:hypothetical protein RNA01_39300 [Ciceribacter naphthalenivorans]GLR21626.1 hypothetical protein GCM10007920_14120 [Ciceribacter naphthalenivorans]GLT04482.1 hypothetical protein GCM10007926_14120 [Sphingomonas psychrolutea]
MGIAISSSSPAVAARCAHARAGAGVVATQNITDPSLGPKGLDLLAGGMNAEAALAGLLADYPAAPWRQVVLLDGQGRAAIHSGEHTLGIHAVATGKDCAAAGNLLANDGVPAAMVAAFGMAKGSLGDRLLSAMHAGVAAGGEAGPIHSAGLYIVRDVSWPIADLRIDWAEDDPIGALEDLWALYEPQLEDYVTRALDPTAAPSYGVPGDL